MIVERVRECCLALPGATEDVKWEDALVFSVAGKMFATVSLDQPHGVWFRCSPEDYAELVERDGIVPAPYLARYNWVAIERGGEGMDVPELRERLAQSYEIVKARLPKKQREALDKARGRGRKPAGPR